MTQALITINASPGSDDDLPINTLVTLANVGNGGELTYNWSILEQPPGTADNLSSPTAASPTFTPQKEGSYLIQLIVNVGLPDEKRDKVIAAVRQLKTNTRVPAAGEEDEVSTTKGWSLAANDLLRLIDTLRADPFIAVAELGFGASAGNVVSFDTVATIKAGLPGQEVIPRVTLSTGLVTAEAAGRIGVVVAAVDGGALTSGKLAYVRWGGLVFNVTVPALTALGTVLYVNDSGILSITAGTNSRPAGRLVALSGTSGTVYIDGAAGGGGGTIPTLEEVLTMGTPNNVATLASSDPIRIYGSAGVQLEVLPSVIDQVLLTGNSIRLSGGRTGDGSGEVVLSTQTQSGAANADAIGVFAGGAEDGTAAPVYMTGGAASGTGDGGDVFIAAGECADGSASPGSISISAGTNNATSVRGTITATAEAVEIDTDIGVAGGVTYRNGLRITGGADVMVANGNPDTVVTGALGSIILDYINGKMYQNTDGATSWREVGGSNVLWEWNQTDVSQFLPAVDLNAGAAIAGLTLTTLAGGPNGVLLQMSSTETAAGGVFFPIDFVFPRRYVIEIDFYSIEFSDTTNAGRNYAGTCIAAEATGTNLIALGHLNTDVGGYTEQFLADIGFSPSGSFGPSFNFNGIAAAMFSPAPGVQSGLSMRFVVNSERPFVAATPQITVTIDGSGADAATPQTYARVNGSSNGVPAYPATWDGVDIDTLGLVILNGGATTSWVANISSFRVLKHPEDM
jgi:hypothetical protein